MANIYTDIPLVDNVGPGETTIIKPSVGKSWKQITIEHTAATSEGDSTRIPLDRTKMTNVKVQVVTGSATKLIREYKDFQELFEVNAHYKRHQEAEGETTLYFSRPELADVVRDAFALGVADVIAVRIEFKIETGVVTPIVKSYGVEGAPMSINHGLIEVVRPFVKGGYATGDNEFDDITRSGQLAALHLFNNAIEHAEIRRNNQVIYDLSAERQRKQLKRHDVAKPRVPMASNKGLTIDYTLSGNPAEALWLRQRDANGNTVFQVQELRVKTTLGAGANSVIRYLGEYFEQFKHL